MLGIHECKNDVGGNTALFLMTDRRGRCSMAKITKTSELLEQLTILSKRKNLLKVVEGKPSIRLGLGMKGHSVSSRLWDFAMTKISTSNIRSHTHQSIVMGTIPWCLVMSSESSIVRSEH